MNLNSEMNITCHPSRNAGARRLRRFTVRRGWCIREPLARLTLKRPEGRAPFASPADPVEGNFVLRLLVQSSKLTLPGRHRRGTST